MQQPAGGGASGSDAFDEGAGAALGAGFGTGGGPLRKDEHESAPVTKLARGIEFRLPRFLHACSKNCTATSARAAQRFEGIQFQNQSADHTEIGHRGFLLL